MTGALNRVLRAMYTPAYRRFMAVSDTRRVQRDYLGRLLANNADTVYGRKYGFAQIHRYREFTERVPLTTYEEYGPYIEQIANGKQGVLTAEPVLLFEPTSGSSGGRKLIPYTASLRAEFQAGIRPWICDLYTNINGLCEGKSYWSITPLTGGKEYTPCGIPIGFEEDAAYFGAIEQALMRRIFAVDGSVKLSGSTEQFWHDTAVQLLRNGDISLISVWNPTYLTLLCSYLRDEAKSLARELPEQTNRLHFAKSGRFDKVFPALRLISLWADGSAAEEIPAVQRFFPGVRMQPKGLLATECFVSFPLTGQNGSTLSVFSHFFEFRELSTGRIVTAERLRKGRYEVIVTTGGGFYRYCIGDVVEVLKTPEPGEIPRIRFLHRAGITSDLCGEKLTEEFVRGLCKNLGIAGDFCLLAPEGMGYTLYTSARIAPEAVEQALCGSYHYHYCRRLGQLRAAD
ncbi:MAG: GH3 auxin-responsive promoter family protein, partial [Oscillospiraceae bacterium]|nr:GH3 auxin-responsive promoter family protein [Oscillospiraceae bacterium]